LYFDRLRDNGHNFGVNFKYVFHSHLKNDTAHPLLHASDFDFNCHIAKSDLDHVDPVIHDIDHLDPVDHDLNHDGKVVRCIIFTFYRSLAVKAPTVKLLVGKASEARETAYQPFRGGGDETAHRTN